MESKEPKKKAAKLKKMARPDSSTESWIQEGLSIALKNRVKEANPKCNSGGTPLHEAASEGHEDMCRLIMEAGISDRNPGDKEGNTPLHKAAYNGHLGVCRFIVGQLTTEENKNPANKVGKTPLYLAAWLGHTEICRILIENTQARVLGFMLWTTHLNILRRVS